MTNSGIKNQIKNAVNYISKSKTFNDELLAANFILTKLIDDIETASNDEITILSGGEKFNVEYELEDGELQLITINLIDINYFEDSFTKTMHDAVYAALVENAYDEKQDYQDWLFHCNKDEEL